ncbi:hypothetical protein NDU88_004780 [Pleurodeles waltl]|uniref:Uncharacterized protein n=1 Tax=Pleurodeles waltl TaxID=8319 RepID=A0AAV7W9W9_PLEWA|nr:hypothetical protein NDU88_004780 [Pleurodeles waltl]
MRRAGHTPDTSRGRLLQAPADTHKPAAQAGVRQLYRESWGERVGEAEEAAGKRPQSQHNPNTSYPTPSSGAPRPGMRLTATGPPLGSAISSLWAGTSAGLHAQGGKAQCLQSFKAKGDKKVVRLTPHALVVFRPMDEVRYPSPVIVLAGITGLLPREQGGEGLCCPPLEGVH